MFPLVPSEIPCALPSGLIIQIFVKHKNHSIYVTKLLLYLLVCSTSSFVIVKAVKVDGASSKKTTPQNCYTNQLRQKRNAELLLRL
jgi:hypothetical protein